MRLLQINPNGSDESALDFHPMVTVVQGLGPSGRDLVLSVARSLPLGGDPGVGGLLEAHGVLLDLSGETLGLLDLASEADVLIGAGDVPGVQDLVRAAEALPTDPAPAGAGEGRASREAIEQFIADTPTGVHPDLDKARRGRADAAAALEVLREALAKSQATYDGVVAEKRRIEAQLDKAQRDLTASADAESDSADGEPQGVSVEQVRERRRELEDELVELQAQRDTVNKGLTELASIDIRPLAVLLDAINEPGPVEYVPSERAHELADEFVDLTHRIGDLEKNLSEEGLDSGSAMRRLEEAKREVAAAQKAMERPVYTDDDIAELEAAHEEVLDAERKVSGLRKKAGEKALEEARAAEQVILDRIGFPTYASYVMGSSLMGIDAAAEARLEKAQHTLQAAQQHWNRVAQVIETNPEYRELLNRLEEVLLEATDLLGADPEDLEGALRALEVPKREVTEEELNEALAYQLELVGLALPPNPPMDLTVMAAEAFIEEAQAVEGRILELREELGQVEAKIAVAEAELIELPEVPDAPAAPEFETFDLDDLDLMAADVDDDPLEVFLGSSGLGVTEERIAELTEELAKAVEDEAEYREWVESREALVDAALQVETVAAGRLRHIAADLLGAETAIDEPAAAPAEPTPDEPAGPDLDAIEFYVLGRQAALRDLSFAGSVPLVIDDALLGLDADALGAVLDKVDELADTVQVIYLSDDAAVADWAARVGFARAAVVQAPAGFGFTG